jgi:succinate dehydrogenase flavin-adding protein (antitoxin of CptAB toxin-antitoxin module)
VIIIGYVRMLEERDNAIVNWILRSVTGRKVCENNLAIAEC